MSDTVNFLLADRDIYPDNEYLSSIIGEKMTFWLIIMNHMTESYKDSAGEWKFYNDGKRWLFKMVFKKKTVFWAGLFDGTFRITFYLGNNADTVIENSDLPLRIKEEFKNAKAYGKIRPVTILVKSRDDVDNVLKMISIKSKIK
jgi:Protein of unknown function (DUF3788)